MGIAQQATDRLILSAIRHLRSHVKQKPLVLIGASSVKIRYIGTSKARVIFPERIDARNGVAVLDARDVAAKQTRTFLNVTLRYWFLFSQLFQTFANNH